MPFTRRQALQRSSRLPNASFPKPASGGDITTASLRPLAEGSATAQDCGAVALQAGVVVAGALLTQPKCGGGVGERPCNGADKAAALLSIVAGVGGAAKASQAIKCAQTKEAAATAERPPSCVDIASCCTRYFLAGLLTSAANRNCAEGAARSG
jgi:hypothetical protein